LEPSGVPELRKRLALKAFSGCWLVGVALALSAIAAGREDVPADPALPAGALDTAVPEVIVEAPEPRFVAPTLRDRIGRIWAPVLINGKGPFRLVVDTGANHSAVTAHVAEMLGIPLRDSNSVMLRGVTGSARVPTIAVESVIVGDLEMASTSLPIVLDALGGAEGILGTEGLLDKRIYIDFRHDRITIFRSHGERAGPGFVTIPVRIAGGLLIVDALIGNVHVKAIIDTGGQGTIANTALRDALLRNRSRTGFAVDEITGATLDVQRGDKIPTPPIDLGRLRITAQHVTAGDMFIFQHWKLTREPVILIGMDVLGLFDTLVIDYRRHELQVRTRNSI
jgi:predicted aspartyl protease